MAQVIKTSASGTGGMGFTSRADQIFHTLSTTRQRCNLECKAVEMAIAHSWHPKGY